MGSRFVITDHALERFAERRAVSTALQTSQYRDLLLAELERGVPFGGQIGNDELYLLPSDNVAAIAWQARTGIVKTVLTREQAIANMQSMGAVLRSARELHHELRDIPDAEAELRALAEEHFNNGIGRKERNAILRELGYDPAGEAGEIYRAAYRALIDDMWARKREEYSRLHRR
jgi:hypothetical protein